MPERDAHFFRTPAEWRAWLEANAADAPEVWVGLFKRAAAETGITWREAVDEALCFGWIDGQGQSDRRRAPPHPLHAARGAQHLERRQRRARRGRSPRTGLMRPAGLAAFARRRAERSGVYSHEQAGEPELDAGSAGALPRAPGAWAFFEAQPPSYRKAALWWVVGAKRPETRERRLATLIADSAEGRRLGHLARRRLGELFRSLRIFFTTRACAPRPRSHTFRLAPGAAEVG